MAAFLLRRPTALCPILMSLAALAIVAVHIALFGTSHEADEGTAAHLWQMLMAGQAPIVIYFAARWLPVARGPAMRVLALQMVAMLGACAPVYFLHL